MEDAAARRAAGVLAMATKQQIAAWVAEGRPEFGVEASGMVEICRVSAIETATADSLVFASTQEALDAALGSPAGLILAHSSLSGTEHGLRVLPVADPRLAFALAALQLAPPIAGSIDPSATIDATVELGEDVQVSAGCVIGPGATVGAGSRVGPRVVIEAGVRIGKRVTVQAGAVLGSFGFGYALRSDGSYVLFPQQGDLVIEDDVEIGANTTIDRGALGETRIGAGTKIDNLVHIGHNCRIGRNVIIAAQTGISGSTVVEDGAILGGQVGIGEHALVGPGVILGGGAGVLSGKKLRGPGQVFWGRPAQPLKQYLRDLARLRKGG